MTEKNVMPNTLRDQSVDFVPAPAATTVTDDWPGYFFHARTQNLDRSSQL